MNDRPARHPRAPALRPCLKSAQLVSCSAHGDLCPTGPLPTSPLCRVVDKDGVPARPGDLLMVELCNLGALPGHEWGYTGVFDRDK